jgi:hypothetical protein
MAFVTKLSCKIFANRLGHYVLIFTILGMLLTSALGIGYVWGQPNSAPINMSKSNATTIVPYEHSDANVQRLLNASQLQNLVGRHKLTATELAIIHHLPNLTLNRANITNLTLNRANITNSPVPFSIPLQNQVQNAFPGNDILANFSGIVGITGYYNPAANDQFQHVIVATNDGKVHELWWKRGQGVQQDPQHPLAQFGLNSIVGITGYYTPNDGIQHVIVDTRDTNVHEVWWKHGIAVQQDTLGSGFNNIVGNTGYYSNSLAYRDGYQHVVVATNYDGIVHEIFWNRQDPNARLDQGGIAQFNGIVGVAGYYADDDVSQHVIVATSDGIVHELYYKPNGPFPVPNYWREFGPAPETTFSGNTAAGQPGNSVSGRVNTIAFSPSFDGAGTPALFIGTARGGVWRSTNFNSATPTWIPLTENVGDKLGLPAEARLGILSTSSIAVDPNHPTIIYAGTGDPASDDPGEGILKSVDGGNTWTLLGQDIFFHQPGFNKIFVDPTDSSGFTLYTDEGEGKTGSLYKTTDGGISWHPIKVGGITSGAVTDIEYTVGPANILTIYAGISYLPPQQSADRGIWRSIDGGVSWTHDAIDLITLGCTNSLPGGIKLVGNDFIGRITLATDRHIPGNIYAAIGNAKAGSSGDFSLLNVFRFSSEHNYWNPPTVDSAHGGIPIEKETQGTDCPHTQGGMTNQLACHLPV